MTDHGGCKVGSARAADPRTLFFWWLWCGKAAPQPPERIIWGGFASPNPTREATLQPPCFVVISHLTTLALIVKLETFPGTIPESFPLLLIFYVRTSWQCWRS